MWSWFVTVRELAYDWFKATKTQEQVLQMSIHEVFVECRMWRDHNIAEKARFDKEMRDMEMKSKLNKGL